MEKQKYFNILVRDKHLMKRIIIKSILQRVFLFSMLILSLIFMIATIKGVYWHIFLGTDKTITIGLIYVILWLMIAIGFLLCDAYNPIKIVGENKNDFNSQLFVLLQLIIKKIAIKNKLDPILVDLFQLLYKYVSRMQNYRNSLYIFSSDEVEIQIDNLYEIVSRKTYRLLRRNKNDLIELFELLSEAYICKMNNVDYTNKLKQVVELISFNNMIELVEETRPSWIRNFMGTNKLKKNLSYVVLISLIIGSLSTYLILEFPTSKIAIVINSIVVGFSLPFTVVVSLITAAIIERWKR